MQQITYLKPDDVINFDRLNSVFISNTNHEEQQPVHMTQKDASVPIQINLAKYAGPESRYCPAMVYEFVNKDGADQLVINAQNSRTARPATSRTRRRTSSGSRPKVAPGRTTWVCERLR
jgi:hypothetical protein